MTNTIEKTHIAEIAVPSPKATINAYRSFGYNLPTAIADVIDNSISAGATRIDLNYKWAGQDSYIMIIDNGSGMNGEELLLAMTPGGKDPNDIRSEDDLGRFGMGLKTASFSQCKKLTVATRKAGYALLKRCWDIDFINESNKWYLLDSISDDSFLDPLKSATSTGTIVLWEKIDRLVGKSHKDDEPRKRAFYKEIREVERHISLVFHKYIEDGRIKFYNDGNEIKPTNPFLLDKSAKPEMGASVKYNNVEVQYFILPHMSKLSPEEYKETGKAQGWLDGQGFYVYRNDRLIVAGDWLGLASKKPYSKLARISVTFKNEDDFNWKLDIKKSTATPPISIRPDLEKIAELAIQKSAFIYNWRGEKRSIKNAQSVQKLWSINQTREGYNLFKVNIDHPIFSIFNAEELKKVKKAIAFLEAELPMYNTIEKQDILTPSTSEKPCKKNITPSQEIITMALDIFNYYKSSGYNRELAVKSVMNSYPFSEYPLLEELYLK